MVANELDGFLMKTLIIPFILVFSVNCSNNKSTHKKDVVSNIASIITIAPNYPRKAAIAQIEGDVKIQFTITKQGEVINPVVLESHPKRIFDQEALRAISKYKFKPKFVNNQPVESIATQVIQFRLANGND